MNDEHIECEKATAIVELADLKLAEQSAEIDR